MSCQSDELANLPLLMGCPADAEWFLVGNAIGGAGANKYARRTFEDIKRCLKAATIFPPYIGVVDRGQAGDPVSGTAVFQNDDLIGLGSTNNNELQIIYAEVVRNNFGDNASITYDPVTGTITLPFPEQWVPGSSLYVDRNQ